MSKRIVKKKEEANGAPAKSPPDARVAQQKRILEVVGADSKEDASEYSPRTEVYIHQLQDVLDFFGYSSGDIAALVQRCNHDEQQIQLAVDNILEDRANHEQTSWGVVKNKKQLKDEKKAREEEEKAEQERLAKEMEKQAKEAKKKAAKEQAALKATGQKGGNTNDDFGASLPPDPAILFAGPNPKREGNQDEWWKEDENWNSWKGGSWKNDSSWEDNHGGGRGQDDWWSKEGWEQQGGGNEAHSGNKGGGRGRKGKGGRGGGAEANKESQDAAEMWDMPTGPDANEGGLDQWSLGDIRKHERKIADLGLDPKAAPPTSVVRTVEEIEREQMGLPSMADSQPAPGKIRVEALFQAGNAEAAPQAEPSFERPEKGKGRGKGKGKNSEKGERPERNDRRERDAGGEDRGDKGERNDQERKNRGEGEGDRFERVDRSEDPRRQPVEEASENVTVKKHSSMGCAVITLKDKRVREAIVAEGEKITIASIKVQIKPHKDKDTKQEVPTDIFAAWGRQVEKMTPLSEREIVGWFEAKHKELTDAWRAETEAKERELREAERAQQKVMDDQLRAQAERQREEERRRFEEAALQRQTAAGMQDRTRIQEAQAAQAKYFADLQNSWMQQQRQTAAAQQQPAQQLAQQQQQQGVRQMPDGRTAPAAGQPAVPSQATAQQQPQQQMSATLNAAAAAYPANAAAAQQWQQQWLQAMAMQGYSATQGWNQSAMAQAQAAQAAQRGMQQQMQGAMGQMGHPQAQASYEEQMRAYYAQVAQAQFGQAAQHTGQYPQNAAAYAYTTPQYGGAGS
eukprot:CAMPEP_0178452620 /NCGR_PEP_ID=MMETSP0689_2-20121128/44346_1 /TAXON_ID=160604 /ORGANISM="Amphidinium massartii, Strain CS-259" /LENGTH=797 /DNA_ID=CAMNT_0020078347 /DNA_START=11 /DNA_END=2401 /DNA_ORIENTATION=+